MTIRAIAYETTRAAVSGIILGGMVSIVICPLVYIFVPHDEQTNGSSQSLWEKGKDFAIRVPKMIFVGSLGVGALEGFAVLVDRIASRYFTNRSNHFHLD